MVWWGTTETPAQRRHSGHGSRPPGHSRHLEPDGAPVVRRRCPGTKGEASVPSVIWFPLTHRGTWWFCPYNSRLCRIRCSGPLMGRPLGRGHSKSTVELQAAPSAFFFLFWGPLCFEQLVCRSQQARGVFIWAGVIYRTYRGRRAAVTHWGGEGHGGTHVIHLDISWYFLGEKKSHLSPKYLLNGLKS